MLPRTCICGAPKTTFDWGSRTNVRATYACGGGARYKHANGPLKTVRWCKDGRTELPPNYNPDKD